MNETDLKLAILDEWPEGRVCREEEHALRLGGQIASGTEEVSQAQRRYQVLLDVCRQCEGMGIVVAAMELAEAKEALARARGKLEKLEREAAETRERVQRWRALRRWANE